MELRVLKYFLIVAREENITKAAQLLHVTQPTLSRQLMQLEEELGTQLFQRSKYRIILTEDGLLLKRRAQEIVDLTEKTEREFLRQEEELSGEIAIGSGELKSSVFLSDALASFRELHPQVKFLIHSGNSDNIKERIERGLLDFGLLLEPVDISKYDFIRLPVKEEWGAFVREGSELAQKDGIGPADLVKQPLIITQREMMQNELMNWFGDYAEQIDVAASGNLFYNLSSLVKKGLGVAVNLNRDCIYPGLKFIPLTPKLKHGSVLVWKKEQRVSRVLEAFLLHVKSYIAEHSESND